MEKNKILIEIYNDEFYLWYINKMAQENKVEDLHSYFLLQMCEMEEGKLNSLYKRGQIRYYCISMIRSALFDKHHPERADKTVSLKSTPFNNTHLLGHANIDDFYSLTSENEMELNEEQEQIKCLIDDVYAFMKKRSENVEGAWADEKLFKMFFEGNETYRSLADKTDIHYCSIFNSIKGTKEIIDTKFKKRYDNL